MGELTVVIPVWGAVYRDALPAAIESVRAADPEARVLVVAPESEAGLLDSSLGAESVACAEGASVGAARNAGLAAVETDYVVFLDADDLLVAEGLNATRAELDANPDVVAAIAQVRDRVSERLVAPPAFVGRIARRPGLLAFANACWTVLPTQGAAIIRTDAARAGGGYADSDGGEDWALGVSLSLACRVAVLEVPALLYSSSRDRAGGEPTAAELRRRAAVARARWRAEARGARRVLLVPIAIGQLLVVGVLRPLRGLRKGAVPADGGR